MVNNHAKCTSCKVKKEHIDAGIPTMDGKLFYIDPQNGLRWRNHVCPECVSAEMVAKGMGPLKRHPDLKRNCKECSRALTLRRARICEFCQPVLGEDVGEFIYCEDPE